MRDPAPNDDLSWFSELLTDDRIALLSDPEQPLSSRLVDLLGEELVRITNTRTRRRAETNPAPLRLAQASRLIAIRDQFDDWWWDQLAVREQDYIVQQRDGDFDGTYAEAVEAAAGGALEDVLVWDARRQDILSAIAVPSDNCHVVPDQAHSCTHASLWERAHHRGGRVPPCRRRKSQRADRDGDPCCCEDATAQAQRVNFVVSCITDIMPRAWGR